jgi:hypothetical protein
VGATPEGVEVPRVLADAECLAALAGQPEARRATLPTGADAKWRFFWRLGPRPAATAYAELNADPVVPRGARPAQARRAGCGAGRGGACGQRACPVRRGARAQAAASGRVRRRRRGGTAAGRTQTREARVRCGCLPAPGKRLSGVPGPPASA